MPNKYFINNIGLLKASGKDLIDFINRMSTNDFRKFPAGEFKKTVLTTDKGRIVDLINILNIPEHQLIITSHNFQDNIISHLNKYIIMDDVILEKVKENYFNIIVRGENLPGIAQEILNQDIEKNKIYETGENEYLFIDDFKSDSLNIICKEDSLDKFKLIFKDSHEQSFEEYEYFRINTGLPEGKNEFNDQINPMECGLDRYISFVKGCYIGQEVIARLDSQGKRPKQMVKINSGDELKKNDKIFTDDKESGFISSAINYDGKNAALGFIRSVSLDFDKDYFVDTGDGGRTKISISN